MRRSSPGTRAASPDSTALTSGMKPSSSVAAPIASRSSGRTVRGACGHASRYSASLSTSDCARRKSSPAARAIRSCQVGGHLQPRRRRHPAHLAGDSRASRADRTSPPARRRASRAAWRCATCRSPRPATTSTGQAPSPSPASISFEQRAHRVMRLVAAGADVDVAGIAEQRARARLVAEPHADRRAARRPTARSARRRRAAARRLSRGRRRPGFVGTAEEERRAHCWARARRSLAEVLLGRLHDSLRASASASRVTIRSATSRRQVLERGVLGGDRRVFARDDVDAGVRAGGGVEHDVAARKVDQLVARAQRAALAADRLVGQQAEPFELVVEQHVEPVARRRPVLPVWPSRSLSALRTSQPALPSIGGTSTAARPCATAPLPPPAYIGWRPQPDSAAAARREAASAASYHDVDQPVGHHDHLAHLRPVERTLDFLAGQRKRLELVLRAGPWARSACRAACP